MVFIFFPFSFSPFLSDYQYRHIHFEKAHTSVQWNLVNKGLINVFFGCAMAQVVSHQPLTTEAWVLALVRHWHRFFSEIFSFSPSVSFYCGSPLSYITWGINNRSVRGYSLETSPYQHKQQQKHIFIFTFMFYCISVLQNKCLLADIAGY
jgi:hypothetical protein